MFVADRVEKLAVEGLGIPHPQKTSEMPEFPARGSNHSRMEFAVSNKPDRKIRGCGAPIGLWQGRNR
jgi:hypothetical protein